MRDTPLRRIFQIGFSLGLRLKHRADRLAAEPLARVDGQWLLWPEEEAVVSALRRARPLRALSVEGAEPVPFRSLAEIDATSRQLTRAERQCRLLAALLGGGEESSRGAAGPRSGVARGRHPGRAGRGAVAGALGAALRVARASGALAGAGPGVPERHAAPGEARGAVPDRRGAAVAGRRCRDEPAQLARAVLERLADQIGPALLGPLPPEVQTTLPRAAELGL